MSSGWPSSLASVQSFRAPSTIGLAETSYEFYAVLLSRYPPVQLAILKFDQSSSAQMINISIGVVLFILLIHFPKSSRYVRLRKLFGWSWDLAPQPSDSSMS